MHVDPVTDRRERTEHGRRIDREASDACAATITTLDKHNEELVTLRIAHMDDACRETGNHDLVSDEQRPRVIR